MCGEGVCRKLYNYLTYNFLLHIFLHNPNIFITFAVQSNNNHKYNNPPKSKFMIIKHLQGGATDFCFLRQCNVWRVSPFLQYFSQ